jgi:hypothetical protein
MSGRTYTMYHTTNVYWGKPDRIRSDQYSVGGEVQMSDDFETTIIRGVPRGKTWSGRKLTLLDIHDGPFGVRVVPARQIHNDELGRRVEVRELPQAAVEKRPYGRSFAWVSVGEAMKVTDMSPQRLLLDYWPLVHYEGNLREDAVLNMLVADSREQIRGRIVDETMRCQLPLGEVEQLVSDENTDWSQMWIPRGFVRDIMLLVQFNWHIPSRPKMRA